MWTQFTLDLQAAVPDADYHLASKLLAPLRARKDAAEIDAMTRAATTTDEVVREVRALGDDVVGMTEEELLNWISGRFEAKGTDGALPGSLVSSGPNGAKPHHSAGDRVIEDGDPVVLDFGTRVDGYPSDQTRTLVFGRDPGERYRRVHQVVRDAQAKAVEAVEPGVTAGYIDRIAREVIDAAGFGDAFVHRTGHGIGLDIHEAPYVVAGNERELEPGMVFTVEPGIYLPGEFGVRIEDVVVVTDHGVERLNETDRGWRTNGGTRNDARSDDS